MALKIKLKLWQAQLMINNPMHFVTWAKHSPVSSGKYAAVRSVLIKGI